MEQHTLTRAQVTARVRKLGDGWHVRKADTRGWKGSQPWAQQPYSLQWRTADGISPAVVKTFQGRSWAEAWAKVEAGTPDIASTRIRPLGV